jgi:hypothetical protein
MMARKKGPPASVTLDGRGVPINDYGIRNGERIGQQRSIVAIAEKGLDYWNRLNPDKPRVLLSYSWKEERDLRTSGGLATEVPFFEGFLNCADWLATVQRGRRRGRRPHSPKPACNSARKRASGRDTRPPHFDRSAWQTRNALARLNREPRNQATPQLIT